VPVFEQFLHSLLLGGVGLGEVTAVAGARAQAAIGSGGTKLEAIIPRSVILASQIESARSVLGLPGSALTCAALYRSQSNPRDSSRKK
jgi:hypothetical protein